MLLCVLASVCALLCLLGMCAWRVCCHQNWYTGAVQQQHSSSSTAAGAVFQALAFVPVVTMCVVGAQQEIEPRQQQLHV